MTRVIMRCLQDEHGVENFRFPHYLTCGKPAEKCRIAALAC
jgi:hypothetical protein